MHNLGLTLICVDQETTPDQLHFAKTAQTALEKNFAPVGRTLAALTFDLFEMCGREKSAAARIMRELARESNWTQAHTDLMRPVMDCYARHEFPSHLQKQAALRHEKQAKGLLAPFTFLGGLFGRNLGALAKTGLLAAGTGAAGLGALNWVLNRDIRHDRADLEGMKEQIALYDRLSDDIENELQNRLLARGRSTNDEQLRTELKSRFF